MVTMFGKIQLRIISTFNVYFVVLIHLLYLEQRLPNYSCWYVKTKSNNYSLTLCLSLQLCISPTMFRSQQLNLNSSTRRSCVKTPHNSVCFYGFYFSWQFKLNKWKKWLANANKRFVIYLLVWSHGTLWWWISPIKFLVIFYNGIITLLPCFLHHQF